MRKPCKPRANLRLPLIAATAAMLLVGVVAGAALFYYDWTMNLTGANPKIRFYRWTDATQTNTINLPYTIYPSLLFVDENATYGIRNNDASNDYAVSLWVETISNTSRLANLTITILNPSGSQEARWASSTFTNLGEAYAVSWLGRKGTIYTVQVLIIGSSIIGEGDSVTCDLRLKTIT